MVDASAREIKNNCWSTFLETIMLKKMKASLRRQRVIQGPVLFMSHVTGRNSTYEYIACRKSIHQHEHLLLKHVDVTIYQTNCAASFIA